MNGLTGEGECDKKMHVQQWMAQSDRRQLGSSNSIAQNCAWEKIIFDYDVISKKRYQQIAAQRADKPRRV